MNRSPLTIQHTIRKHDEENPAAAIFANAPQPVVEESRLKIPRLYRRGVTLKAIARRMGESRAAVYRVIIEERVARLNKRKVKFIDDPLYHQEDAARVLHEISWQDELANPTATEIRLPKDLPSNIRALCEAPLLSPSRERGLFLEFNFYKMQFVMARRRLDPQFARRRDLDAMEQFLAHATEVKNEILRANLRLIVSVAKRHMRPGLSLMELISDGSMTLMRAIESFDVHRGNKFSTYATLALMKGFARSVPQMIAMRAAGASETAVEIADHRAAAESDRRLDREQLHRMMSQLETRERDVLAAHFGLGERGGATYEQVGRRLGISKARVRQIEQSAIAKLRAIGSMLEK
jgi:RNA polymerase sigma factor (sigma-70 family)